MITALIAAAVLLLFALLAQNTDWSNVLTPARNDLVFAERNQDYGAYRIRQEHHRTMVIAFLVALGLVGSAFLIPKLFPAATPPVELPGTWFDIDPTHFHPPTPIKPKTSVAPAPPSHPKKSEVMGTPIAVDSTVATPIDTVAKQADPAKGPTGPASDDRTGSAGNGSTGTDTAVDSSTTAPVADKAPTYPGGETALYSFLERNISYPQKDIASGREGQVLVAFIVGTDGTVTDVRIQRGVSATIDAEALRVVRRMKKWNPGSYKGKPVSVWYSIPIRFRLKN